MNQKAYIQLLRSAGSALQAFRDQELRSAGDDTAAAILALSEPFLFAIAVPPPAPTSGIVEFQKYMRGQKR